MGTLLDSTLVRPYGDHLDDGLTMVSFTLPVPFGSRAKRAAMLLARKMGLERPLIVHAQELTPGFSYFIIYGSNTHEVDFGAVEGPDDEAAEYLDQKEVELFLQKQIGRPVTIVGASTGTDTHTIGLDAILNLKGYSGENGLERYKGFNVHNLGGQMPNEVLLAKAVEVHADVVMVAQTVTQQGLHVHNLTELVDMAEAEGIRDRILLICGGPFISDELAKELGYDRGFSKGSYPSHIATYIVRELAARKV